MSDTKDSSQSRDAAPRRAGTSAMASANLSKPVQGQTSTATQYWQSVAAAGRAAKLAASAEAATPSRQCRVRS